MLIKITLIVLFLFPAFQVFSQTIVREVASPASASINRRRGLDMLDQVKEAIKADYYDKAFHGIDLDARFRTAAERIKTMETNSDINRVIAQVLLDFNDSHTTFLPPDRANRVEYGFSTQMIGDTCFVVDVKKGGDAETKGLKVGDVIDAFGNTIPTRENLWKLTYLIYSLAPSPTLKLFIRDGMKPAKELTVNAVFKSLEERKKEDEKRRKEKREDPFKCQAIDETAIACKLRTFSTDRDNIDKMMKQAAGYKKLIFDLRGNGGGYVRTQEHLTAYFFDREVRIAKFIMRNKVYDSVTKPRKEGAFMGDLVVLIDSNSASASEVFSRVIQIEKRGQIVGDVSAGKVMMSQFRPMLNRRGVPGFESFSIFGLSLTMADLIMSDGKRLENAGVVPEHLIGPTGKALFEKSYPILAYAAGLLKISMTSQEAGKFYFLTKSVEDEEKEVYSDETRSSSQAERPR